MTCKRIVTLLILAALLGLPVTPSASVGSQANTYIVNSKDADPDANPGNGICATAGGKCTLVAAIQEANADGVNSIIHFAHSFSGTEFINGCSLPGLAADNTTIDASDQWDTTYDRPGVEIMGGPGDLLVIQSDWNTVRGILFGGTDNNGIHIQGGNFNVIGGSGTHQRNVFHSGRGVWVEWTATNNVITSNYFGTIDGEYVVSSTEGIRLHAGATNTTIEHNLISGHTSYGIYLLEADNNYVRDNIIGANAFKSAPLPNANSVTVYFGILNTIGPDNWIVGNTSHGVDLISADDNVVTGNTIGYCFYNLENGGDGIHLINAHNNQINANAVRCNDGNGVHVESSDGSIIQGNGIGGNGQDGVYIVDSPNTQIGGSGSNEGNSIGDNGANGVHLDGTGAHDISVAGNDIGLSIGAFDAGNHGHGVLVENGSYSNTIGGTGAGEGNWIAWNDRSGIYLSGSDTHANIVVGNVIGAPINWDWEAPNGHHGIGIYAGAHDNFIGVLGLGNTILSSGWSGIAIVNSDDNLVLCNHIGTDGADVNWGNSYYGVVVGGSGNGIGANEIAYNGTHNGTDNGQAGVLVDGASAIANTITTNSIHDNDGPGIELVNGGNHGLGAPTINQASCQGPVIGTSCAGCTVEIFSDNADEGRVYEGSTTADATTGAFSWSGMVNGPNVTATSTHPVGHTSSFATPFNVGTCNTAPTAAFTVNPDSGTTSTVFNFDASSSSDPEDPTSALQVRWDWENDNTYDTNWSTTKTATRTFPTAGLYTIRLQVQDTSGLTDATTRQVSVGGQQPTNYQVFLPLVVRQSP
jgi:parallel beta-helix repeat protein